MRLTADHLGTWRHRVVAPIEGAHVEQVTQTFDNGPVPGITDRVLENNHWNAALRAGVRREQLEALSESEGSDVFSPRERAVIRFAREVTRHGRIDQDVWDGLGGLDLQQQMEMVLTVARYNCVVRTLSVALDVAAGHCVPDA